MSILEKSGWNVEVEAVNVNPHVTISLAKPKHIENPTSGSNTKFPQMFQNSAIFCLPTPRGVVLSGKRTASPG